MKKEGKPKQFPKNYRFITEKIKADKHIQLYLYIVFGLLCLAMISLIGYFSLDMTRNLDSYNQQSKEKAIILSQIRTWESITEKFQGYKDGYLQLAVLEYRLGDFTKAKIFLDKALYLDPNYKEAIQLENKLKNY